MRNLFISFFIPFLAGLATMIGILPTYISKKHQDSMIVFSLAFSAGVMINISVFSLLVEAYKLLFSNNSLLSIIIIFIYFIIGIIFSIALDFQLEKKVNNSKLYQLGIFSFFALIIHNIPEGITTFLTTSFNLKLGISLSLAIALHNIPEGIAIAIPIFYSTNNHKKAFLYTLISGFSEFLGSVFAFFFLKEKLNSFLLSGILSSTAGIMLYISFFELIPNSLQYKRKSLSFYGFFLGNIVMLICHFIFHI